MRLAWANASFFATLFILSARLAAADTVIIFSGSSLLVNAKTNGGNLYVEIQDSNGNAINGFTQAQATAFNGDQVDQTISWSGGSNVSSLAGRGVRLKFILPSGADLYSYKFQ